MKRLFIMTGAILALLLALFALGQALGVPLLQDPSPWLRRGGAWAALLGFVLLAADVLLPVPSSLVMVANGALLGVLPATVLSMVGSVCATLLGFALGRHGKLLAHLAPPAERAQADALLQRWGALAIIVTRPLPLLADAAAILAGASSLTWRQVAVAAAVGAFPPSLLYALAGATAAVAQSPVLMGVLVLSAAAIFWQLSRWAQRFITGTQAQDRR